MECVGEERCQDRHERRGSSCAKDLAVGLYCSRYKRFYCAGIGNCATPEEYAQAMREGLQ